VDERVELFPATGSEHECSIGHRRVWRRERRHYRATVGCGEDAVATQDAPAPLHMVAGAAQPLDPIIFRHDARYFFPDLPPAHIVDERRAIRRRPFRHAHEDFPFAARFRRRRNDIR